LDADIYFGFQEIEVNLIITDGCMPGICSRKSRYQLMFISIYNRYSFNLEMQFVLIYKFGVAEETWMQA
jgi:hypothetical protein